MDKISGSLYDEIGYDRELAKRLEKQSFYEITKYWKPFEAYAVERLLSEPEEVVIDLGGGHSVYQDVGLFARVKKRCRRFRM